jgi:hypothetical protein
LVADLRAVRVREIPESVKYLCADAANTIESLGQMFDQACEAEQQAREYAESWKARWLSLMDLLDKMVAKLDVVLLK